MDDRHRYGEHGVKVEYLIADANSSICGGKTRSRDGVCKLRAGWGTDHPGRGRCRKHFGNSPMHKTNAAKLGAVRVLQSLGQSIPTDPVRALLDMVSEAAGNVAFLREQVRELGGDIIGTKKGATPGIGIYDQSEEAVGIVRLYNEERDRLAKIAKMAVDAGVAEAQVRIAQQQADTLATIVRHVLDGLDLTPEQQQLGRRLAAEQMRTMIPMQPEGAERS